MIVFQRSRVINATPNAVWSVLGRFMQVDEFSPAIVSVDALTKGDIGVGSKRRNNFKNGTSLVEEVIEWNDGKEFTVQLSQMDAMPLQAATARVEIQPVGERSRVTWTFSYRVKFGFLGWLLGQTLFKVMMGKVLDHDLKALEEKVCCSPQSERLTPALQT